MDHDPRTGQTCSWPGGFTFCTRDVGYARQPAENCSGGFEKTDFVDPAKGPSSRSRGSWLWNGSGNTEYIYLFAN